MRLIGVGLGPGDPELVTMKGVRAIESAGVIFVPRSRDGEESLALRIARPWIAFERQQVIELALPMTRDLDQIVPAWRDAADQIATHLAARPAESHPAQPFGVYLLLGDPLLYGTFIYISRELAEHYPQIAIEVIPGITSFAAAAARTHTVLGMTSERAAIVPASYIIDTPSGQDPYTYLSRLFADFETVVFLKIGSVLPQLLAIVEQLGLLETTIYAERVGMPEEVIVHDVRQLRRQARPYLSLLIVRSAKR